MHTRQWGSVGVVAWMTLAVLLAVTVWAAAQPAAARQALEAEAAQRSLAIAEKRRVLNNQFQKDLAACESQPTCVAEVKRKYDEQQAALDQEVAALNAWHDAQRRLLAVEWDCPTLTRHRTEFQTQLDTKRAEVAKRLQALAKDYAEKKASLDREVARYNTAGVTVVLDENGKVRTVIPPGLQQKRYRRSFEPLLDIQRQMSALDKQMLDTRQSLLPLEQMMQGIDAELAAGGCL